MTGLKPAEAPPDFMSNHLFTLQGISKSYKSGRFKKKTALSDINITIPSDKITGIIGPDGAGKSSLLKILAGLLSYKGNLLYRGADLSYRSEDIKKKLSFMPQGIGHNLYMDLTVDENIDFFGSLKGVPEDEVKSRKEELLRATGLIDFRTRYARELSGGMKQKLGICCSLISSPELLILDEPSTGIDPLSRRELWRLLINYTRGGGRSIIIGTSYMDEADRCHLVSFLYQGKDIFHGHPDSLSTRYTDLEEAFFQKLLERGAELQEISPPPRPPERRTARPVEIEDLTKSFGSFIAVDNLSLQIRGGEVFGLLGPNGAGKTTLIKCITGLLKPDSGIIRIGNDNGSDDLSRIIGYMSQVFSLYGDLTVRENIELYGSIHHLGRDLLMERMKWIIDFSGLEGNEETLVRSLPLGMKQRLSLGVATIHLPDILFLDEPTSGVDPVARKVFWDFIRMLSGELGITVIVTTHNLIEADYCDRIAIMDSGKIIGMGSPDDLRERFIKEEGVVFETPSDYPINEDRLRTTGLSFSPFGRRYHLWGSGIKEEDLHEILRRTGHPEVSVRKIRPPMEDVFIHFLTRQKR